MTRRTKNGLTTLTALSLLLVADPSLAVRKNGFVLDDSLVPSGEILSGGPPRDGIPSIDRPRFVVAEEADPFFRRQGSDSRNQPQRRGQGLPDRDPELSRDRQ